MSTTLRDLLLPELEAEFDSTRKTLGNIPDGHTAYKPHEKSFPLSRLAGHTAELPNFINAILTTPDLDFGTAVMPKPYFMETTQQALALFNELADKALTALKNTSDDAFHQNWKLSYKGHDIYSGTRYMAYRQMGLNHLIHHRAQLGVYLRLLNAPVPGCYGPTADEPWNG